MKLILTPSYYLTDETAAQTPRLVKRSTGEEFGPDDILQWYPSWEIRPVWHSVGRAVAIMQLTDAEQALVSAFIELENERKNDPHELSGP